MSDAHTLPPTLRVLLEMLDVEVREAVGDVDRSLIQLSLAMSPWDRLRSAGQMAQTLASYRREAASQRD